jgi:prophage regulatory protein
MKLLGLEEVIELTGLSTSATIYRYEACGRFPRRRQVGPNAVRWLDEDLIDWMKSRPPAAETAAGANVFGRSPASTKH